MAMNEKSVSFIFTKAHCQIFTDTFIMFIDFDEFTFGVYIQTLIFQKGLGFPNIFTYDLFLEGGAVTFLL